jgi:septal ring factor EnvC (AmiA/AmiB activator)
MTRILLSALIGCSMALAAGRADDVPPAPPTAPGANPADALQKQLKEIRDEISALRVVREEQLKNIDAELKLLAQRLNALEGRLDDLARTRQAAAYTPTEPQMATIRLQNRSGVPATVLLSGRSYRLPPLETIVLQNQPVGVFTYEVLAEGFGTIRNPQARTLVAGETFSITVMP